MSEIAARAKQLGHTPLVTRRDFDGDIPTKFYVTCSCGYAATIRRTEREAVETVVYHLGKSVGEVDGLARRNGRNVPRNVSAVPQTETAG